jgi:hypothetical protein
MHLSLVDRDSIREPGPQKNIAKVSGEGLELIDADYALVARRNAGDPDVGNATAATAEERRLLVAERMNCNGCRGSAIVSRRGGSIGSNNPRRYRGVVGDAERFQESEKALLGARRVCR